MEASDLDSLCKRLRNISEPRRICIEGEAADAIEKLEGDNAALRNDITALDRSLSEANTKRGDAERENAALRQLLADMKPHWDGFTRKVIWTAAMAGVMADIRTRLDAALLAGKKP